VGWAAAFATLGAAGSASAGERVASATSALAEPVAPNQWRAARLEAELAMPGVFIVRDRAPLGEAVLELSRIASQSTQEEWAGLVVFLPARR
jgi:hypothetical protein